MAAVQSVILWLLFLFGFTKFSDGSRFEPRIAMGIPAPLDFLNFTVKVVGSSRCAATIISKRHLLTAMHCLNSHQNATSFGSYSINYYNYSYSVEDRYRNPGPFFTDFAYVPNEFPQPYLTDIAVLEFPIGSNLYYLYGNETNEGVLPVTLANDYIEKEGDIVTMTGYDLLYQNVSVDHQRSGGLLIYAGKRIYTGNSGGPLLVYKNNKWYQIGICGPTIGGTTASGNAVCTRISSFCDFIEEVTNKEVQCETMYPERPPLPSYPPIYKGDKTPKELFDFVIPLYPYSFPNNETHYGCTATVISPRHLLTTANCVYKNGNPVPTEYQYSKTVNHTFFADFRSKSHQAIKEPVDGIAHFPKGYYWYLDSENIAIVEYPEGTDFGVEPVALAKDYIDIYQEKYVVVGYGNYTIDDETYIEDISPLFRHFTVLFSTGLVGKNNNLGYQMWMATSTLTEDEGGPALIEKNGKFYQVGIANHEFKEYDSRIRISFYCDFIAKVTNKEVECESIYEPKFKPSTPSTPELENTTTSESTTAAPPPPTQEYHSSASNFYNQTTVIILAFLFIICHLCFT